MDRPDPTLGVGEEDLRGADDRQREGPADVRSRQPGEERRDEDRDLEVVDHPAHVTVVVERVGAEELSGGEVDLDEDSQDDQAGGDEVEPVEDTPKGSHA